MIRGHLALHTAYAPERVFGELAVEPVCDPPYHLTSIVKRFGIIRQPIIDHFRRIDEASVLGLMETRELPPCFFLLVRAGIAA